MSDRYYETKKRWRENNREKTRESQRKWKLRNPKKQCEYQARFAKANPKIIKAQNLVNNRNLPLGSKCEFCGGTEKLEHGHLDYDYPEIYLTVCHQCNYWMGVDQA